MTILSFVAIFTGLGVATSGNYFYATALMAGVFIGSAIWWLMLSFGAALLGRRFNSGWLRLLNRLSGSVILAFGIYSLFTALAKN